uniref:Uncharacterized protein n=1 Tax=Myotis myotis TaxID=51298 RepID=A0A7J7UQ44_MYOMY|nr:hypothetical protein mMyoMyo1_008646 [Myotis myotis]
MGPQFGLGPALALQLQPERLLEVVEALEMDMPPALHPAPQDGLRSSTQVNVQHLVVEEDPWPLEWMVAHTVDGQERPEVNVVTGGSGEPGPVGGWRRTPPPKPPRPNKPPTSRPLSPNTRMTIFNDVLERYARISNTRREDPEPREAEPKGE